MERVEVPVHGLDLTDVPMTPAREALSGQDVWLIPQERWSGRPSGAGGYNHTPVDLTDLKDTGIAAKVALETTYAARQVNMHTHTHCI